MVINIYALNVRTAVKLQFKFCFQSSVFIIDTDFCLWIHHEKCCKLVLHSSLWAGIKTKLDKVSIPIQYITKNAWFRSLKLQNLFWAHLNLTFHVVTQLFYIYRHVSAREKNERATFPEQNINIISCANMFFFITKKIKCLFCGCNF